MTSPFLQPAWTIDEAVLLVEASENIVSKTCDTDTEVRKLSERLRKSAELTGLTVSSRYRNEENVRNNLKSMSSMLKMIDFIDEEYLQGSTLGTVALYYRKHPDRYAQLLEKANQTYPVQDEKNHVESEIKVESSYENILDLSGFNNARKEYNAEKSSSSEELSAICKETDRTDSLDIDIINKEKKKIPNDELNQIDTVSEEVSVYHIPRRRRPRISNGTSVKGAEGLAFSTVFPYISSKYGLIGQHGVSNSMDESVCEAPVSGKDLDGWTNISREQNEETGENYKTDILPYESRNNVLNTKLAKIKDILTTRFRRGYRIESALDRKRFREYYKSRFGQSVGASEEVVEGYIRNLGFVYDGKVYIADVILSDDVRNEILRFIIDILSTERDYVYYEYLYEQFRDEIESSITDTEMLRLYLKELNKKDWIFQERYIASSFDVRVSVKDELLRYMQDASEVMELDQVKRYLAYLPQEEIEYEWNHNSDTLISNGPNERFHIEVFYCPKETLNTVASLIETGLKETSFMTNEGLFVDINHSVPELIANNNHISELGIRNALAKLLSRDFSFKNNIISRNQDSFDGPAAILAFCKEKGNFTFEEVEEVSKNIKCAVNFYLDKIYEKFIRVDEHNFVPRTSLNFEVKNTDLALDLFVNKLFTPVREITAFDAFPSCGEYSWNKWILENYLLTSSKKYCLVRPKYLSKESVTGAIVRKDRLIKTYDDLIIQAIANSDIPIEEEAANEYLYEMGIINARRKNGQVKKLLIKAREYRNRINKNKNKNNK